MIERDATSGRRFASRSSGLALAAAMGLSSLLSGGVARGQAKAPVPARAPAIPAAAPTAQGLDALGDEMVMNELASRGIKSLLNKMFDDRKVPKDERDAFAALQALRELGASSSINNARRILLLRQSVEGLNTLLPKMNDPVVTSNYAATLIGKGIEPDVNILEYWGDNSTTQARIRQASRIAVAMMRKASDDSAQKVQTLGNLIKNANDPRINDLEKFDELATRTKYVANISAYYEVVSIDVSGNNKAGWDERKKIADAAIRELVLLDNPDTGVGPIVKMRIAKLQMGKGDYASSKKTFLALVDKKTTVEGRLVPMLPEPSVFEINEAKYFAIISDVLAKRVPDAEKATAELEKWQTANMPKDPPIQKGLSGAFAMLKYRLMSAKADLATGPAKDKLNQEADAILTELGEKQPQYQSLIIEQLVTRMPENADLSKQGVPVLQALISRGNGEQSKPEGVAIDDKVLARGLAAAREMVKPETLKKLAKPEQVENAKLYIATFLEKQGKLVEAGQAFLDYGTNPLYMNKPNAALAVDRAGFLAYTLNGKNPKDPEVRKLYGRALQVAADPPFNRPEVFFARAEWLRTVDQDLAKAMDFYRKVPKGDKAEFAARYWQLDSADRILKATQDGALRNQQMREMTALIDNVRALAQANLAASTDPKAPAAATARLRLAHTTLIGADLATQQKQFPRTIQLLTGYEESVAQIPNNDAFKNKAIFLRAGAFLGMGNFNNAIGPVMQLAGKPETADFAIGMVKQIFDQLESDFEVARKNGDREGMARAAANQAKLTGFFVTWATSSKDPKINKTASDFVRYDATTKLKAGELASDPAEKDKILKQALAVFTGLKTARPDDSSVSLGIAYCSYGLNDFNTASSTLGMLIRDGKLGNATTTETDPITGAVTVKENSVYWEASYKWIKSNLAIAAGNPTDPINLKIKDGAEKSLKSMIITYGEKTGGEKMGAEYAELRKQLLADWVPTITAATMPSATTVPSAATAPSVTQPAAAGVPAATQPSTAPAAATSPVPSPATLPATAPSVP